MNKTNIFLGILIISIIFRLISLNQSLWLDEGIMAYAVETYSIPDLISNYMPGDFNPPLYFVLLWAWVRVFGLSEIALRIPSVIFGLFTVIGIYYFAKKADIKTNIGSEFWAAVFVASAPLLIYYSQEARMYMLATCCVTWSMYYFYRYFYLKEPVFPMYVLLTVLVFWSHYIAWFIWIVQLLWLLWVEKKEMGARLGRLMVPLLGIIVIAPVLSSQLSVGTAAADSLPIWKALSSFSIKQLLLIPIKLVSGRIPFDDNILFTLSILIALCVWIVVLIKSNLNIRKGSIEIKTILSPFQKLLWLWLVIPVCIGGLLSLKIAIFSYFRFLYIAPALYLLAAYGLQFFSNKKSKITGLLLICLNVTFSLMYLLHPNYHREDWKGLVSYITSRELSNEVVILGSVDRPFSYYDKSETFTLIDYKDVGNMPDIPALWLVGYAQPIFDPNKITENTLIEQLGYEVIEEKYFRGDIGLKYLLKTKKPIAYDNRY